MPGKRKPFTWIVTSQGCHECDSHHLNVHGYPMVSKNNKGHHVHRIVYEEQVGPIPTGMVVRHKCDNRKCINPYHLELGSPKDNSMDCKERGRLNTPRGELRSDMKIKDIQVQEIRASSLSQSALAKKYGVNQSTISRIKTGKKRQYVNL